MARRLTIRNDYHDTEAVVLVPPSGILTVSQVRRVRRKLCGMSDCCCGGLLKERGKQEFALEPLLGGRVRIELD